MILVTKPYADQIAKDRGEAMDRIIQMSDTPTPSDGAMTADTERALKWLRQWIVDITIPQLHRAEFAIAVETLERLTTERTKLAADLARVVGERDDWKEKAERRPDLFSQSAREDMQAELAKAYAERDAAEAKSARLADAARAVVISTSKLDRHGIPDTDMEPIMLGKLRALSAAIAAAFS